MGKLYENLTNAYTVAKTLRMELIPTGKTAEHLSALIARDEQRAADFKQAKKAIDKLHIAYIDECMESLTLTGLDEFEAIFCDKSKADELEKVKDSLRKQISSAMPNPPYFNKDNRSYVLEKIDDPDDKAVTEKFINFVTYFVGYNQNRENIYTSDNIAASAAYRLINDNLPKFLNNKKCIYDAIEKTDPEKLNKIIDENGLRSFIPDIKVLTETAFYNKLLSQRGIDLYNRFIGGISKKDNVKTQGLNEIINLYNQQCKDNKKKIGKLAPLFKQILSERESASFIPDAFDNDDEVIAAVKAFYEGFKENGINTVLAKLFDDISAYDLSGIYVINGEFITLLSQKLTGDWGYINNEIIKEYDESKKPKNITDRYIENRKKDLKKVKAYSFKKLNGYLKEYKTEEYFKAEAESILNNIDAYYTAFVSYDAKKQLIYDKDYTEKIKNLCDEIKKLQILIKPLNIDMPDCDSIFYGELGGVWEYLNEFTYLYNKIRNYLTKKPYSTDKFKLTFDCSDFMSGWGKDYGTKKAHLFCYMDNYYLGIVNEKLSNDDIESLYSENGDAVHYDYNFQKMDNKNFPRQFIRSKGENFAPNVKKYDLPVQDILEIYDRREFSAEFRKKDPQKQKEALIKLIDYFKSGISKDEIFKDFSLKWKESSKYNTIDEFYNDVCGCCYKLTEEKVSFSELERLADEDKMYLFRIYNKDFSPHSTGTPNLHTMYFKALFDRENLENTVYKISGGAEMYFRKKSISDDEKIVHKANIPIPNKNADNPKKESVYNYDIIKDRRYTLDKFFLHIPIEANFKAGKKENIREKVNRYVKYNDDVYSIGIDRGERNLLYLCVVDPSGKIAEQKSLNIINNYDYRKKLKERADARQKERRSWKSIENISNLKEGYLSLAIHEIVKLMLKYDAVLVLENLNFGFKKTRQKIELNVYQKFEQMLITKLNYLVEKNRDKHETAGLFNALQLSDKFVNFQKLGSQNGVMFYVPAWLTSKIDPVTGFADLFYLKYKNIPEAQKFFGEFERIGYNAKENYFEFTFDYNNFSQKAEGTRTKWTVCTYKDRVYTFRNKDKNNQFDSKTIILTDEFKALFKKYDVALSDDMQKNILEITASEFYMELTKLFKLTVQLRNSVSDSDIDFLISPVKDKNGKFFDSRFCDDSLPYDADANGAYNIARKGLMYLDIIRNTEDKNLREPKLEIKNKQWLNYVQDNDN